MTVLQSLLTTAPSASVVKRALLLTHLSLPLLCSTACRTRPSAAELSITRLRAIGVPANDPSDLCSDVGDARVCWSRKPGDGLWVGERTLPGPNASEPSKYRCTGTGQSRQCRLRSDLAPPFRCRGAHCAQILPRVPDDGDWECSDLGGAVLCRGGSQPAGVTRPGSDPGWWCGARKRSTTGERVCLDLDPDYPPARGSTFRCTYRMEGAKITRLCEPSSLAVLGSRCNEGAACPNDSRCVAGVCLPQAFLPDCWGDADCAPGRCAYGACTARRR